MTRTRQTSAMLTPRRTSRSYSEIVRLLINETAARLDTQRKPEFTLGASTPIMRRLLAQYVKADRICQRITKQLERRGARVYSGRLSIHHTRSMALEREWNARKAVKAAKLRSLKTAALVDLIGMPAEEARGYLQKLRAQLEAVVSL
jgi:hypothetical protein